MTNYLTNIARRAAGLTPAPGASAVVAPRQMPKWNLAGPGSGKREPASPTVENGGARVPSATYAIREDVPQAQERRSEGNEGLPSIAADGMTPRKGAFALDAPPLQGPLMAPRESPGEMPPSKVIDAPQTAIPKPEILPRPAWLRTSPESEDFRQSLVKPKPKRTFPELAIDETQQEVSNMDEPARVLLPRVSEPMRLMESKASLLRSDLPAIDFAVSVAKPSSGVDQNSPAMPAVIPTDNSRRTEQRSDQAASPSPGQARVWPDAGSEASPEQQVNVHIGAIEIRTPERPRAAEPPVLSTPPAPAPAGFESFARLRVYAPWIP